MRMDKERNSIKLIIMVFIKCYLIWTSFSEWVKATIRINNITAAFKIFKSIFLLNFTFLRKPCLPLHIVSLHFVRWKQTSFWFHHISWYRMQLSKFRLLTLHFYSILIICPRWRIPLHCQMAHTLSQRLVMITSGNFDASKFELFIHLKCDTQERIFMSLSYRVPFKLPSSLPFYPYSYNTLSMCVRAYTFPAQHNTRSMNIFITLHSTIHSRKCWNIFNWESSF